MNRNMVQKLQKLQKEMQETQERLQMTEFEGKASGVRIVMLGSHQVVELKIDPELLEDIDMLQDAVLLAINDAVAVVDKKTEEEMSRFTMGMGF
ncbi:MAG: YbaB/EbfC family nucleoid-associated protein [Acholeplasmataceae bacterium]|nr:YbaB/EbfC family nucleoid-associated protein [Acholeplasmataceae bacterium]